jgi:hypothetical protein
MPIAWQLGWRLRQFRPDAEPFLDAATKSLKKDVRLCDQTHECSPSLRPFQTIDAERLSRLAERIEDPRLRSNAVTLAARVALGSIIDR